MDILGIGPMELILILIVALLVFGPDKLPTMGAKLGRTMRDMRKATRAISNEINATRDAITAEAKPITDPLQEAAGAVKTAGALVAAAKNPGLALRDSVLKELNTPVEPENTIAPPSLDPVLTVTPAPEPPIVDVLPPLEETSAPHEEDAASADVPAASAPADEPIVGEQ